MSLLFTYWSEVHSFRGVSIHHSSWWRTFASRLKPREATPSSVLTVRPIKEGLILKWKYFLSRYISECDSECETDSRKQSLDISYELCFFCSFFNLAYFSWSEPLVLWIYFYVLLPKALWLYIPAFIDKWWLITCSRPSLFPVILFPILMGVAEVLYRVLPQLQRHENVWTVEISVKTRGVFVTGNCYRARNWSTKFNGLIWK